MSSAEPPPSEREPEGEFWVDRWVLPFARDPALWPILFVLVGHAAAFIAPALLLGLRDGAFAARAALVLLAFLTYGCVSYDVRRFRRPSAITAIAASVWALAGVAAWGADRYGLF